MASLKKVKNIRQYVFSGRTRHDDAYAARGISATRGQAGMYSKERHYDVLQELGGWSDYEMVGRYAHLSVEHLAEYADGLTKVRLVSTKLAQSENEAEKKRIA